MPSYDDEPEPIISSQEGEQVVAVTAALGEGVITTTWDITDPIISGDILAGDFLFTTKFGHGFVVWHVLHVEGEATRPVYRVCRYSPGWQHMEVGPTDGERITSTRLHEARPLSRVRFPDGASVPATHTPLITSTLAVVINIGGVWLRLGALSPVALGPAMLTAIRPTERVALPVGVAMRTLAGVSTLSGIPLRQHPPIERPWPAQAAAGQMRQAPPPPPPAATPPDPLFPRVAQLRLGGATRARQLAVFVEPQAPGEVRTTLRPPPTRVVTEAEFAQLINDNRARTELAAAAAAARALWTLRDDPEDDDEVEEQEEEEE